MALTAAFETKAFRLKSVCGREYHVPVKGVAIDYAQYLVKEDKITWEEAKEKMSDADVKSWFAEQFDWRDVETYGVLVKEPTANNIARALNVVREGLTPANAAMARMVRAD